LTLETTLGHHLSNRAEASSDGLQSDSFISKADDENHTDGHDAAGTTTIFRSASILKFCFYCSLEKK
jgi:hypothetical protein